MNTFGRGNSKQLKFLKNFIHPRDIRIFYLSYYFSNIIYKI